MTEDWDDKHDLLSATRPLYDNEDYWRFLVRDVWRIAEDPRRVVDLGCGFGWAGQFLMPMLAAGSDYTGLDRSRPLIERGRAMFAARPHDRRFVLAEATSAPFDDNQFDVAFAHALLMHLPDPACALAEMIRFTRDGGLVITCDARHNAMNALLHVHETDEQDKAPLSLFQAMNADLRRRTGVDHNIGMKTPVLMQRRGCGTCRHGSATPSACRFRLDTADKERLFTAICDDGLAVPPMDDERFERSVSAMMARGALRAAAEAELRREINNDYRNLGRRCHIVQPGLITISLGWVTRG